MSRGHFFSFFLTNAELCCGMLACRVSRGGEMPAGKWPSAGWGGKGSEHCQYQGVVSFCARCFGELRLFYRVCFCFFLFMEPVRGTGGRFVVLMGVALRGATTAAGCSCRTRRRCAVASRCSIYRRARDSILYLLVAQLTRLLFSDPRFMAFAATKNGNSTRVLRVCCA